MLSMNSLNAAMSSYAMLKTVSSIKTQTEGRNHVLESEIASGNGNLEAKQEEIEENTAKVQKMEAQIGENMVKINESLNKPMTEKEKEALREEKAEAEKQAEKEQEKAAAQKADGSKAVAAATPAVTPNTAGSTVMAEAKAGVSVEMGAQSVDSALVYDVNGSVMPSVGAVGQLVDVSV